MGRKTEQLVAIQYLRGVAALLVVLAHTIPQIQRVGYDGPALRGLVSGVDIFFVISGFIMWRTAGRIPDMSPAVFVRRRLVRIVPLYWIISSVMLAVGLVAPALLQSASTEPVYVLKSFLFIPAFDASTGDYFPLLKPGWTLNCEMAFYALFALAVLATRDVRLRAGLVIGVLGALVLAGLVLDPKSALGFYTRSEFFEFALGMILAMAFEAGRLTGDNRRLAAAFLAIGVIGLVIGNFTAGALPRLFAYGLPATALMVGALGLPTGANTLAGRLMLELGDISYSLYLSHGLVMSACGLIWRKLGLVGPHLIFVVGSTLVCVAAGFACHRLLERPLLSLFRERRPAPVPRAAEAPAA